MLRLVSMYTNRFAKYVQNTFSPQKPRSAWITQYHCNLYPIIKGNHRQYTRTHTSQTFSVFRQFAIPESPFHVQYIVSA